MTRLARSRRSVVLPPWTDPSDDPQTRHARLTRQAAQSAGGKHGRPRAGALCDTCQQRARNCECPDGPDLA